MNGYRVGAAAAATLVVTALSLLPAGPAEAGNRALGAPYAYTVGDDIARRMASIFRITAGLESATIVTYDRKSRTIVTEILGSAEEVEEAKREIEAFAQAIRERVAPYAKKHHGVVLADADVTLIFYNDTGEEPPYEIVRRENGAFVEPAPDRGD
ncbi:MAG TPA: hypothetical protein VFU59_05470 [Candidatus Eisenbacteria bacterium]|nr:hypothetical protein [Candidatus Eisenbacteria bacterium]